MSSAVSEKLSRVKIEPAGVEMRKSDESEVKSIRAHAVRSAESIRKVKGATDNGAAAIKATPTAKVEKMRKPCKADLHIGQVVFYKHHHHGWIFAKVTSIDYQGASDGGVTYVIEAPQISGVLETVRKKLFTQMPDG